MKNKSIILFVLVILLFNVFSIPIFANTLYNNEDISFYIQESPTKEIYKPGDSDYLKFVIKNNTSNNIKLKNLYFTPKDSTTDKLLKNISKYTNVIIKHNDNILIEGLLYDLINNKNYNINLNLSPNYTLEFDMYIHIDESMGNEYQNCYEELYINTDYIIDNDDNKIHNNQIGTDKNQSLPSTGDTQSSPNTNENQSLPSTGDNYNNYILIIFIISIILLLVSIKKGYKINEKNK